MKKQLKIVISSILFACVLLLSTQVKAANLSGNEIIKFNNYTITETTTIEQISNVFGQPKIVGKSAFGGQAYSFYDDGYTWYLHIETNSDGKIKGFGCIEGDFVAKEYKYGDDVSGMYSRLSGTKITDRYTDELFAYYGYNCTYNESIDYLQEFASDSEYLYDLQKHTIIVSKIFAKRHDYSFTHEAISDEIFYMNENLKANGTDLYNYAQDNGKTEYIHSICWSNTDFFADLPNPIKYGSQTEYYVYGENCKYLFYDITMDTSSTNNIKAQQSVMYIDPDFLNEKETVELNTRELDLLEAVQEQYALYNEHGQAITQNFDVTPVYNELPLVAGKWSDMALYMATDYLNIARAGLGIQTLTLNQDIADCAQHKATLVYYLNNVEKQSVSHVFDKPDCVDDEFYNKSMSYMNENLFHGNIQVSIVTALNDAYGDPVACGHRYNLLYPGYTEWGTGAVGSGISYGWQGCHKFSGYTEYENELVAWPSNGIFPMDLAYNGIGNWTAKFYKYYSVSEDTEVTIKCLNSGKIYEITNENKNESTKLLQNTGDSLLTFRDDNIAYENGDVFEITLHNVLDRRTSETTDYTYRSVFLSLYQLGKTDVTDISLNKNDITLLVGESDKIDAIVAPADATNKLIKFSSSNDDVVSVRQDGTLIANKAGKVTIEVRSLDSSSSLPKVIKTVTVTVKKNADDPDNVKGDLDRNGVVNANDAAVALDLYKYNNATDEDMLIGDVDENGVINANDAALILDIYKYGK